MSKVQMSATAKVFMHGGSQAVRLPKDYRFQDKELRATKIGNRVILEPMMDEAAVPWDLIDETGDMPFMPQGRDQPPPPPDRIRFKP